MFQIGGDLHILAAIDRADIFHTRDFLGKADAACALDAAGHHRLDDRTHIFLGDRALILVIARRAAAICDRLVLQIALAALSSEERRVGKESVSTCKSQWSQYH